MKEKKRFFSKHAKSSAALISLALHAVLIVAAISFVAVKVITKEDQVFEAKTVNRAKMPLKKLQVPVNIKKKALPKPKLRKRIVVNQKANQNLPDIKMPEFAGVKGGMGSAGSDLGGAAGVGFTMPEMELFGVKSKGEKIFLILDTGNAMMENEMGGIAAYTIIKQELIRIVEELPSTALFNVCVFDGGDPKTAFADLVSANSANAAKVKAWLEPLNDYGKTGGYGIKTLGEGGVDQSIDLRIGKFAVPPKKGGTVYGSGNNRTGEKWFTPLMLAMKQQADSIFLLTDEWGYHNAQLSQGISLEEWIATTSDGKKWAENLEKAKKKLEEENEKLKAAGKAPRVIAGGRFGLIRAYYPNTPKPPKNETYEFVPADFVEAFLLTRKKYRSGDMLGKSGLRKSRRKIDFSLNVIQFVEADKEPSGRSARNFVEMTSACNGEHQTIAGLEAIQSYVKPVKDDPEE